MTASISFKELWGTSVFHYPYCHSWEVQDKPLAIYGNGEVGFEMVLILTGWSRGLILCSDDASTLRDEQRQQLSNWKIELCEDTSSLVSQIGVAATNGATAAVFMNWALIEENLVLHN